MLHLYTKHAIQIKFDWLICWNRDVYWQLDTTWKVWWTSVVFFWMFALWIQTHANCTTSVASHLSYPGPLQLSLAVSLFVEQGERFSAGRWWRSQAGTVPHWKTQCDKHPWSGMAVQERSSQPVVLQTGILIDVADLKGPYEPPPVIQDADLIPLRDRNKIMSLCVVSLLLVWQRYL